MGCEWGFWGGAKKRRIGAERARRERGAEKGWVGAWLRFPSQGLAKSR